MTDRRKRFAVRLLQWTLATAGFVYVAAQVDWRQTGAQLLEVDPLVVVAVLLATAVEFGSRFSMWYVLLNNLRPVSFTTTVHVDLTIKFINHVIPSKASGHSVAPLILRHYVDIEWSDALAVSGVNTGLYAALYGSVALLGAVLFAAQLSGGLLVVVLLSTGLYLVAGALVLLAGARLDFVGELSGSIERFVRRVPGVGDRLAVVAGALPTFTTETAARFRNVATRPLVVLPYTLGWTGTLMIVPGLRVLVLLTALGSGFEPAVLLPVALVMAYSVTVLPVTPGGVGVAEASATVVLSSLGVAPEVAGVVVLLDRTLGVYLPAMLGWIPTANMDLGMVLSQERG